MHYHEPFDEPPTMHAADSRSFVCDGAVDACRHTKRCVVDDTMPSDALLMTAMPCRDMADEYREREQRLCDAA